MPTLHTLTVYTHSLHTQCAPHAQKLYTHTAYNTCTFCTHTLHILTAFNVCMHTMHTYYMTHCTHTTHTTYRDTKYTTHTLFTHSLCAHTLYTHTLHILHAQTLGTHIHYTKSLLFLLFSKQIGWNILSLKLFSSRWTVSPVHFNMPHSVHNYLMPSLDWGLDTVSIKNIGYCPFIKLTLTLCCHLWCSVSWTKPRNGHTRQC